METLLNHIRELSRPTEHPRQVFSRFTECMRAAYGPVGVVVFSRWQHFPEHQWQLTGFCCHDGNMVKKCSDLFVADPSLPTIHAPFLDQLLANHQPQHLNPLPSEFASVFHEHFSQYQSAAIIPLFINGNLDNWLVLLGHDDSFLSLDLMNVTLLANLLATDVMRITDTRQLRQANEWIEREIDEIANIQLALLPQSNPNIPGVEVAVAFDTFARAGGDYYDLVPLKSTNEADAPIDTWGVIVADAAGHGASASVETAMFDAILRTYSGRVADGPASVLNYANRYLFTRRIRGTFITAFIANYHIPTGVFRYTNAGHPQPLLKPVDDPTNVAPCYGADGIPLGVEKSYTWEQEKTSLVTGDLLVLYTDGVTETTSPHGEQFGIERLQSVIAGCSNNPHEVVSSVQSSLAAHRGEQRPKDDLTLLAIKLVERR